MVAAAGRIYVLWGDSIAAYDGHAAGTAGAEFVLAGPGPNGVLHPQFFTAAFGSGKLFATVADTLYAFDPEQAANGQCHAVASKAMTGEQLYWVSIASGVVVVDAGSKLIAFDADTLQVKWETPHDGRAFPSLAISGGRVFETTNTGDVRALSLTTGVVEWHAHVAASALLGAPSVGGDLVYVHGETLAAFPTSCGTGDQVCSPIWSAQSHGSSPAAIAAGHVVVSSAGGVDVFSLP